MKKGIVLTANILVMVVFLIIAIVILFFLYGSFAAEAGRPESIIFYNFLDWIVNLVG